VPIETSVNEKTARHDERILCADLIKIVWTDKAGSRQKELAVLEDISPRGVCLQMEHPVPIDTSIAILYPSGRYHGRIRYCVFQDTGYFLGVEFDPGYQWSRHEFTPSHLLDLHRGRTKTRRARV
jgi:hypothetical protein